MSDDSTVCGFWDYGSDSSVVIVDEDGAGTLACADTPGDQLRHLSCPLGGPCQWSSGVAT